MTLTTRIEDCLACNDDFTWAAFPRKYTKASIVRGLAQDCDSTQRQWLEECSIAAGFVRDVGPRNGFDDWYEECPSDVPGAIKVWIVYQ